MFGLYRHCCSSKDNISVDCRDNGSNLNTFTNSSNLNTIQSSILYNRTHRSETCKIMNVLLLLLFLLFGSCVMSFGSEKVKDSNQFETTPYAQYTTKQQPNLNELKEGSPVSIAPRKIYLGVPSMINGISMFFLTKVIGVKEEDIYDEECKEDWFVWLSLLGLNDIPLCYETDNKENNLMLVGYYFISTILAHSLYRGLFSVKLLKKIKEVGNCELYFGVSNVPYVGELFNLSLVCKPTFILKYLPHFLHDKEVTIHIIDLKPFNFILGCVFSTLLIWYTECEKLYIRPQWIVGFGTVEIQIAKYYNISLNVGSLIVDLIAFMKYTKKSNRMISGVGKNINTYKQ